MEVLLVWTLAIGQASPSTFDPPMLPAPPAVLPDPQPATEHIFLLQFDQDRNGVLTLEELPEPLRRRFDKADLNRDGNLDARELLVGATRISREARKAEDIRITRQGLAKKGQAGPDQSVLFRVGSELLRRLDHNGDGWADGAELGSLLSQPGVLFGDKKTDEPASVPAPPVASLSPSGGTNPLNAESAISAVPTNLASTPPLPFSPVSTPSRAAIAPILPLTPPSTLANTPVATANTPQLDPTTTSAPVVPDSAPSAAVASAMPDAPTILKHLDKNGNGQLDRDEAVDQLADNFARLDKNGDGMLNEQEIKRGLFLARLLGIRPKQDPRSYRTQ